MLAQGSNFDEWGDILVIAVMAILWLVGGLAKVITGRKGAAQQGPQEGAAEPQRQRATWQDRLARKAQEIQQAAEARSRQAEQDARARGVPPVRHLPRRARSPSAQSPRGESVMIYERPAVAPVHGSPGASRPRTGGARGDPGRRTTGIKAPSTIRRSVECEAPSRDQPLRCESLRHRSNRRVAALDVAHEAEGGYAPAAIIDYSDPDALRKAILLYEILGKPLALREPADETSSF